MTWQDDELQRTARYMSLYLKKFYDGDSQETLDAIQMLFKKNGHFYQLCKDIRELQEREQKILERDLKSPYKESLLKRNNNETLSPSQD